MHRIMGAALAVALLAGCSGKSGSGGNSSAGAAAGGQESQEPANLTESQTNMAIPVTPPSPTPIAAIPSSFQGRWASTALECDAANAAIAKGLMAIAGDRISFYESRGTAARIRQLRPNTITFDLPMSGEGQTWSEATRLTILGDGRTLVRQTTEPRDRAGASTYQRCPS